MVANLAFGEKEDGSEVVPDADEEEMRIFLEARRHLPASVFDAERWQAIAGDLWAKVVYVLNRGGRFEDYERGYKPGIFPEAGGEVFGLDLTQVSHPFGTLINIYQEKTYDTKSAMTGEHLVGYPRYFPGPFDVTGQILNDEAEGFDLRLITYREIMQTKSRTSSNYWLLALLPENFVLMHKDDADARGLEDGDRVRIISPTNLDGEWDLGNGRTKAMIGKVKTTQGIRPGVVAFSLGFGHWSYGGADFEIDGKTITGDERRLRGIHANAAMRIDPYLGNTTLIDPVGGSAVFYDTFVRVEKV
jgi:anaerobic selenocysteine-containing dehydrogenase